MFTVFIEGLDFYGYHGVPDEERAVGHRYLVDLEMAVEGNAPLDDEIRHTVDYSKAAQVVQEVLVDSQVQTLERLAGMICERLLQRYDRLVSVKVTVRKPMPPMPFVARAAGVQVLRDRL
ncbi:MAG TPA: dihydroneopterin aldolase [Fimbriimonadaceae bacterium]|nr:dihydroneopterin aldolase [Fimbriimonadaceae bacterium]